MAGTEAVKRRSTAGQYWIVEHRWQSTGYSRRLGEDQLDKSSMHRDRRKNRVI